MDSSKYFKFNKYAPRNIRTTPKVTDRETMKLDEKEQPLSPMSRMFHEPNNNVYIVAIFGFKTEVNPDIIKNKFACTWVKHPRFSSLQVLDEKSGEMKWVRTDVDIENHVIVPKVGQNLESPQKFVEDYISKLSQTTMDMSKPLWDLHVLQLKTSDAESIAILRMHHSFGDGVSLMSLLVAFTREESDRKTLPSFPLKKQSKQSNSSSFWFFFFKFVLVLWLLWNTMIDVVMFIMTALFLKDSHTPLKNLNDKGLAARRFVYKIVSFDDVKMVKNVMNTTVNDVILGVTQAGLSRYLNRKYGNKTTEKDNNLPKQIRLRATLIANMRQPSEIQALASETVNKMGSKWGNCLGQILLPFSIALREDPLEYVRVAKATMDRKKFSLEAVGTSTIMKYLFKFFGVKGASIVAYGVLSHTTLLFSNMPGPQEGLAICGYPINYLAPTCYGSPTALVIHIQSYVDKLAIVFSVDEKTIPDPHQLCDDLEESLKLIKNAAVARGLVKDDATRRG